METRIHKIISVSWTLLFLVFAALQINDPDPLVWVSIYGAAAGFTLWNSFGKVPPLLLVAAILTALIFAFLLWPEEYQGLTGKMDSRPGVEFARESLGLVICALGAAYVLWRSLVK